MLDRPDLESAGRFRLQARELGQQIASPGWLAADLLLMGEEVVARDDPGEMAGYLLDDDAAEMISPIGRALMGHLHARCGNTGGDAGGDGHPQRAGDGRLPPFR